MKRTSLTLQSELESVAGYDRVYFQPTENTKLAYPCVLYDLDGMHTLRANDKAYLWSKLYNVTIISKDPDYDLYEKMLTHFEHCSFERTMVADNLHHWYLTLYW